MKVNGAPEKLYLLSNGLIGYCRNTDEDVEYHRTDAFIEKVCSILKDISCPCEIIEQFKNRIR